MMTSNDLKAKVRYQPGVAIIDLSGELNTFVNDILNKVYTEASSHSPALVLLNFEKVNYINSAGIGFIIDLVKQAQPAQHALIAYGLSPFHRQLFDIVGLTEFIPIFPDEASALVMALVPA